MRNRVPTIPVVNGYRGDELVIDLQETFEGVLTAWMKQDPNDTTYRPFTVVDNRYLIMPNTLTIDGEDTIKGKWYWDVEQVVAPAEAVTVYQGTILFKDDITNSSGIQESVPPLINIFEAHIADDSIHVTPDQSDALDGAAAPSAVNPVATMADIGGGGDMLKSVYDTDDSGVVDDAEKVNGLTVETAVPSGAVFTDTQVDIQAGTNVTIDKTNPLQPIISASGGSGSNLKPSIVNALDSVAFTESVGVWTLKVNGAFIRYTYGNTNIGGIYVEKLIVNGAYNYLIASLIDGDVSIITNQATATTLLEDTDNILMGIVYPSIGLYDMNCRYNIEGVRNDFEDINKYVSFSATSIIAKLDSFDFIGSGSTWDLIVNGVFVNYRYGNNEKNGVYSSNPIPVGWVYIIASLLDGGITIITSKTTATTLLEDRDNILVGVVYPSIGLYDMNCRYSINGVRNEFEEIDVNPPIDLTIDTPLITNTIAFLDELEIPFYKDSLFKELTSGKKYNVVLETEITSGIKRYEINNPTYLKASDIGSNSRMVFEGDFTDRKLIYKDITKIYKAVTSGKSGSIDLMTIGDSITQGEGSYLTSPLEIIRQRLLTYGVTTNSIGTFDMRQRETVSPASNPATYLDQLGEGRGFWNYKTFVGKDSTPYGQPITINTAAPYTTKWENPFIRLALAADTTNNPTWCFSNAVANPSDVDGVSYATDPSQPSGNYYIFDFVNYLTAHSVANPDIITIALGTNDWQEGGIINIDDEFLSYQIMYAQIRAALPTTPILLIPTQSLFPEDQPEWENEMFPLAERIIKDIELNQLTDSNLYQIPVFQHASRFMAFKTLGIGSDINANNNIQTSTANDVHILNKDTSQQEYIDIMENVIMNLL